MTTEPSSRAFAFARARASSLPPSRVDRVASSPAARRTPRRAICRPRAAERRRVRRRIRSRARRARSSTTTRRRLSSSPSSATPRARPRCGAPRSASPRSSRGDTSPSSPRARSGADASRYGEGCVVASPSPSSPSSPRLVSRRRPPLLLLLLLLPSSAARARGVLRRHLAVVPRRPGRRDRDRRRSLRPRGARGRSIDRRHVLLTLVPIRPRSRGERRSLRTLPGASLRPPLAFNPRPRCLSTPSDAFQLHPEKSDGKNDNDGVGPGTRPSSSATTERRRALAFSFALALAMCAGLAWVFAIERVGSRAAAKRAAAFGKRGAAAADADAKARSPHTGPHTTASARCTPFLKDFLFPAVVSLRPGSLAFNPDTPRRLSTPLLTPFNSTPTSSLRTDRA